MPPPSPPLPSSFSFPSLHTLISHLLSLSQHLPSLFGTNLLSVPPQPPSPLHSLASALSGPRRPFFFRYRSIKQNRTKGLRPLPPTSFGQTGPNERPPFGPVWPNEGPPFGPPFDLASQTKQNGLYSVKQDRTEAKQDGTEILCSVPFGRTGSRRWKERRDEDGAEEGGAREGKGDEEGREGEGDEEEREGDDGTALERKGAEEGGGDGWHRRGREERRWGRGYGKKREG